MVNPEDKLNKAAPDEIEKAVDVNEAAPVEPEKAVDVNETPVPQKKKRKKKAALLACSVALLALIAGAAIFFIPRIPYYKAVSLYNSGKYLQALPIFEEIPNIEDSSDYIKYCNYDIGTMWFAMGSYAEAKEAFTKAAVYDYDAKIKECDYEMALQLLEKGEYQAAKEAFSKVNIRDSSSQIRICDYRYAAQLLDVGLFEEAKKFFSSASIEDYATQIKECDYAIAGQLFDAGNYQEAKEYYASASIHDFSTQIKECDYQLADQAYRNGDTQAAVALFAELENYRDAAKRYTNIVFDIKYSKYNDVSLIPEMYRNKDDYVCATAKEAEDYISQYYGTWCNPNDESDTVVFDFSSFDSYPYSVIEVESPYLVYDAYPAAIISGSYSDGTPFLFLLTFYTDEFYRSGGYCEYVEYFSLFDLNEGFYNAFYYKRPYSELQTLIEENNAYHEEIFAQQQAQALLDSLTAEMVNMTYDKAASKLRSAYNDGTASVFYHACNQTGYSVSYDEYSGTYYCEVDVEYTDNIFDFYGTSTTEYVATAEFIYRDGSLTMRNFNIW